MAGLIAALALTVVPDARYRANAVYRFFFGSQWRDAWTVPIEAPVLDLDRFDGGLKAERRGGGLQTINLHFKSANGRTWVFRSMDKDPTRILDPDTRESVFGDILQDLTSTVHPCAALVVAPLLEAAGVPHATPELVVLPDDERLRPFGELGGMLGFMEERIEHRLAGSDKQLETVGLIERLEERGEEQVDARAYLRARLIDILVGDWDRHVDQWRWVRFREGERRFWRPVPRDRDQAFSRFDAIVPAVGEYYTKQLASFHEDYPAIEKLTFSGRYTDRRFLVPLEKREWDEVTAEVKARLTDAVIADAVRRLPPAMVRQGGDELERDLRARRDRLGEASQDFYELLARQVNVQDPADAGPIEVKGGAAGVEVSIRRGGETIFRRTFLPRETSEIRLYTAGEGRPLVDPAASSAISIRVAATRAPPAEGARDWGHDLLFFPQLSFDSTRGLVPGARALLTHYGFELEPFSSQMSFSAAYATTSQRPRLEYAADLRTRSPLSGLIYLAYSGMDSGRFYGIGNETVQSNPTPGFYDLRQEKLLANALAEAPLAGPLRARVGVLLETVHTREENVVAALQPYGAGWMTVPGGEVGIALDTRAGVLTSRRGFNLLATVRFSPAWFGNEHAFTKLRAEAATALGAHLLTDVLFDLRIAGEKNWGTYPFFDAAYVGGAAFRSGLEVSAPFGGGLLRGYDLNRFAGDASLAGNAELRVALGKANLFLPLRYGVAALGDLGRVFADGESSSRWHFGAGGGLWVALFATATGAQLATSINAMVVRSDERTSFYLSGGFGF
ncbi:MAG TPA: hypothetical protein VFE90_20165 [Myxococcales bacterium]|jgi:hypothetical protein|nr:hypothetical protein [Myxococcales bacterium]